MTSWPSRAPGTGWARPRLLLALLALAVGGVALVVSLRGGDEPPETVDLEFRQVAFAAERTAAFPGARAIVTGTGTLPVAGLEMEMTGVSVYDGRTGRSRAITLTRIPGAPSGPFNPTRMEVVGEGDEMYMRSPSFARGLPDGRTWMLVRLPEGAVQNDGDPRRQLEYLQDVARDVQRIGAQKVRGVPTTHYAGVVDHEAYLEKLREQGHEEAAEQAEQIYSAMPEEAGFDIWVDRRRLVRRLSMEIPFGFIAGEGATLQVTLDFTDFGIRPRITVPPPSAVFDATELGQEYLDELTGG